jgi:hypothetical protein
VKDSLSRYGLQALIAAAVVLLLAGVWIRPADGVDALPGFYALTGAASVGVVVFAVRALHRVLTRPEDEYDAD